LPLASYISDGIWIVASIFSGSLMDEKFEIAEWKGCQIVTFKVVNDLNNVDFSFNDALIF
jgi:hypothetical protein